MKRHLITLNQYASRGWAGFVSTCVIYRPSQRFANMGFDDDPIDTFWGWMFENNPDIIEVFGWMHDNHIHYKIEHEVRYLFGDSNNPNHAVDYQEFIRYFIVIPDPDQELLFRLTHIGHRMWEDDDQ